MPLFLFALGIISVICVASCLGIYAVCRHLLPPENAAIIQALASNDYILSLIVSSTLSAPMLLELIVRILSSSTFLKFDDSVFHHLFLLLILVAPNMITIFYIIPRNDFIAYEFLFNIRFMVVVLVSMTFLHKSVSAYWNKISVITFHLLTCIGVTLNFYSTCTITDGDNYLLDIFFRIIFFLAILLFLYLCHGWYMFIQSAKEHKLFSIDQYLGNLYVTSLSLFMMGSFIVTLATGENIKWYETNSTIMCCSMLPYIIFYLAIIVFESRALERNFTMMKVRDNRDLFMFILLILATYLSFIIHILFLIHIFTLRHSSFVLSRHMSMDKRSSYSIYRISYVPH